jgi:hypothetical protein
MISVLGVHLPLSACVAMVIASTIFGAAHLNNSPGLSKFQAVHAGITSLFVEAPLYYFFGFWASCFSHIITNTVATTIEVVARKVFSNDGCKSQSVPAPT